MRKTTRSMVFLGVFVALLGAAVYAELAHERTAAPAPLTALDPAAISHIEVRCNTCRTRRFARTPTGWHMLEPFAAPANPDAIARLLAIARAPVRARLSLPDYDLAKLGLDPPQITLILDELVITVGDGDPIEHDRYVHIGDELLRAPDRFSARLLESPESELANPADVKKD